MKQYYLLSVAGSGGMFVSALMLHYMGLPSNPQVSATGDCHDLGNGTWRPADDVFLIGDRWEHRSYRRPLLYSHYTNIIEYPGPILFLFSYIHRIMIYPVHRNSYTDVLSQTTSWCGHVPYADTA